MRHRKRFSRKLAGAGQGPAEDADGEPRGGTTGGKGVVREGEVGAGEEGERPRRACDAVGGEGERG